MYFESALTPRVLRHVTEHKKLQTKAEQVAAIHLGVTRHAIDHAVLELQSKSGFMAHDLFSLRVWTRLTSFTVVFVPMRLWYRPVWRRRAFELKRYLRSTGTQCILAPASYLDREPRLQNARLVAASKRVELSATDRLLLLRKIDETSSLSLAEASACLDAKDPAAAVLHLVAERALSIDPDRMIGPHSIVALRCI